MAIFSSKKTPSSGKAAKGKEEKKQEAQANTPASGGLGEAWVLRHARITEKASMHQSFAVYTFDIAPRATKRDVVRAVQAIYKVYPVKVAIVPVPSKERRSMKTGKRGVKRGGKKAYVYLKKGETITIG